jgi:PAS domain S-box-containing protein
MNGAIRLLHLEDDPGDAETIRHALQAEALDCDIEWVRTEEEFRSTLWQEPWALVLCDYELGGIEMLRQVRQEHPELPVILISAGLTGEEAVDCMKAGATDCVVKSRQQRLGSSVRQALADRQQRAALRHADGKFRSLNAELEARARLRTAELETANSFLNSLIQHIPYMVTVKSALDLTIVRVNRHVEELMGMSKAELVGKSAYDLHRVEEAEFFTAKDKEALALGREVDIPEETLHTPGADMRILHTKKLPILDDAGQPRYLLTMSEDITERKKREREIERLNAALAQRTTEVEAANRAKSIFLATMSHEIRTPMNGMLGMLELLSLTELDAEQRETLALVRESSHSLLRIIDDILDFSKIEAGKLEVRPEVVFITKIVEEVQSIYSGNASSKGLIVRRTVDPRISPALRVDPVRLRQILNNFVSNAIKFTAAGEIEVRAEWIERKDGHERVQFVVKDTGIGISPEDQQRLFRPFSQVTGGVERLGAGGTGLGLVIARQLAHLMGGAVSLQSEPGKGTTVTLSLTLPIAEPLSAAEPDTVAGRRVTTPARRVAPDVAQAEAEGTLVLLVDDHPVNRMLLLRQVRSLGYAAQAAEHGLQALEMWKAGRFGLVVTDCHMPHMDGYELARCVRRLETEAGRAPVPIIACTANAMQGEAELCFAAGMSDFLVKPVELSQLADKLGQWLPIPADAAPAAEDTVAHSSTPPIDQALLAATCGRDASLMDEVLATFLRSCQQDSAALEQALAAHDAAEAGRLAHRMGGASTMVGARDLAAACEKIDRAGRCGDWKVVLEAMPVFERERMRLQAWLKAREERAPRPA